MPRKPKTNPPTKPETSGPGGTIEAKKGQSLTRQERDSLRIKFSETSRQRDLLIQSLHRLAMSLPAGGDEGGETSPGGGLADGGGIAGGHAGGGTPALKMGAIEMQARIDRAEWHCHLLIEIHQIGGGHAGGETPPKRT
jgi:hypothetical protein